MRTGKTGKTKNLIAVIVLVMISVLSTTLCEQAAWDCPECGRTGNTGEYCGKCAHQAPWVNKDKTEGAVSAQRNVSEFRKTGNIVKFGHYEQDNLSFGPEDIEWIVLDYDEKEHKALLLSRYGLDMIPYNEKSPGISWEECTLRAWLNNDFMNRAFSTAEQSQILMTEVDNGAAQGFGEWNTDGGNNTQDYVFLLSYAEANWYLNVKYKSVYAASRTTPTAYAVAMGAKRSVSYQTTEGEASGWWWLRSPGDSSDAAASVAEDGSLISSDLNIVFCAVRPALWLKLDLETTGTVSGDQNTWDCPECGKTGNTGKYCGRCANPIPKIIVAIDEKSFPDKEFRNYIKIRFDLNGDGGLSDNEIDDVTEIRCNGKNIQSLKGVEWFTGLNLIECSHNQLNDLDISRNKELESILCNDNRLTSLDVSRNPKLMNIDCGNNRLIALDVSRNKDLEYLRCYANQLASLDVSKNIKLKSLDCSRNRLKALDVSCNEDLEGFNCNDNQLASLDISRNPKLKSLDCRKNQLKDLDIRACPGLLLRTDSLAADMEVSISRFVRYGHYEQDNDLSNGAEEIDWVVLAYDEREHKSLLLSRYGLDAKPFTRQQWEDVTWEDSTLRKWLNSEFLKKAFSEEERAEIVITEVDNSASQGYSVWSTKGSNNTKDQIFLLSYAEVNRYFSVTFEDDSNTQSRVAPTAYAVAQGAKTVDSYQTAEGEESADWWLRSIGQYQLNVNIVFFEGNLSDISHDVNWVSVRPAIWLDLDADIY